MATTPLQPGAAPANPDSSLLDEATLLLVQASGIIIVSLDYLDKRDTCISATRALHAAEDLIVQAHDKIAVFHTALLAPLREASHA